ncbi:hypothetical protein M8C21_024528, partial [Ambrosia artemisiifolia]
MVNREFLKTIDSTSHHNPDGTIKTVLGENQNPRMWIVEFWLTNCTCDKLGTLWRLVSSDQRLSMKVHTAMNPCNHFMVVEVGSDNSRFGCQLSFRVGDLVLEQIINL